MASAGCGLKSALIHSLLSSVLGHVVSGLGGIADGSGRGSYVLLGEIKSTLRMPVCGAGIRVTYPWRTPILVQESRLLMSLRRDA